MIQKTSLFALLFAVAVQCVPYAPNTYGPGLVAPLVAGGPLAAPLLSGQNLVEAPAVAAPVFPSLSYLNPAYFAALPPAKFLPPVVHAPTPVMFPAGNINAAASLVPLVADAPYAAAAPVEAAVVPKYGIGAPLEYASRSVAAAILSTKQIGFHEFINSPSVSKPTNIFIDSPVNPVNLVYRSLSSPVSVQQTHLGQTGSFKQTNSMDDPHHYIHTVTKPIIQELHEIIAPVRKVKQEVLPVQEEIKTLIAKGIAPKGSPAAVPIAPIVPFLPDPVLTDPSPLVASPILHKGALVPTGLVRAFEPQTDYEEDLLALRAKNADHFDPRSVYLGRKKAAASK